MQTMQCMGFIHESCLTQVYNIYIIIIVISIRSFTYRVHAVYVRESLYGNKTVCGPGSGLTFSDAKQKRHEPIVIPPSVLQRDDAEHTWAALNERGPMKWRPYLLQLRRKQKQELRVSGSSVPGELFEEGARLIGAVPAFEEGSRFIGAVPSF